MTLMNEWYLVDETFVGPLLLNLKNWNINKFLIVPDFVAC